MSPKIAVIGATGNVGTEMLNILAESDITPREVVAIASSNSIGREVSYGDEILRCKDLTDFDFTNTDIALMSAGGAVSKVWAPRLAKAGVVVIDNSSYWRMDKDVPLIVPEVNLHALGGYKKKNIIANPNCSTIQLVVALKPLHDKAKIKRVVVSTYQSTSGAGKAAMDELWLQTKGAYVNDIPAPENFSKQIAFNVIPQIDVFLANGDTKEEWKMEVETKKILDANIKVTATCVRVPTFVSHAESVNVELTNALCADEAREILRQSPGILLYDKPDHEEGAGFITPLEATGEYAVYISRIRKDTTRPHALNMWVVADNLRKGAALNAVQIAEALLHSHLK